MESNPLGGAVRLTMSSDVTNFIYAEGWDPIPFCCGSGGSSIISSRQISVFDTCKDTIDQLPPNHDKPRSRCVVEVLGRNKVKRARLDGCQLAFGLDDANFSIADLEEGAKLFVFPGHTRTWWGVWYNITI